MALLEAVEEAENSLRQITKTESPEHQRKAEPTADAKKILIEYEDGTIRTLSKGVAAEFDHNEMNVEMIEVSPLDMVRIAYGMLVTVDKIGMTPLLQAFVNGELLPDEI